MPLVYNVGVVYLYMNVDLTLAKEPLSANLYIVCISWSRNYTMCALGVVMVM